MEEEEETREKKTETEERRAKKEDRRKKMRKAIRRKRTEESEHFDFPAFMISVWNLQFQAVCPELCCCVAESKNP